MSNKLSIFEEDQLVSLTLSVETLMVTSNLHLPFLIINLFIFQNSLQFLPMIVRMLILQ